MRIRSIGLAWLALLAAPIAAHSYRVVLSRPAPNQKMLVGHAGVQSIDDWTPNALVRIISPGAEVRERGTIRVLVMNFGNSTYSFGPEDVLMKLADGTTFKPAPLELFLKGKELVEGEAHRRAAVDFQNRNDLAELAQQAGGGITGQPGGPGPLAAGTASTPSGATAGQNRATDDDMMPGSRELDAINQILDTQPVPPRKAWGGYYVFDVPKSVFQRQADQPLTILVTTGGQLHRFNATLKWK